MDGAGEPGRGPAAPGKASSNTAADSSPCWMPRWRRSWPRCGSRRRRAGQVHCCRPSFSCGACAPSGAGWNHTVVVFLALGLLVPRMLANNCSCSFIMFPVMSHHAVTALDMSDVGWALPSTQPGDRFVYRDRVLLVAPRLVVRSRPVQSRWCGAFPCGSSTRRRKPARSSGRSGGCSSSSSSKTSTSPSSTPRSATRTAAQVSRPISDRTRAATMHSRSATC